MTPHRRDRQGTSKPSTEIAPWLRPQRTAALEQTLQAVVQRWVEMTRFHLHVATNGEITVLREALASESGACVGRRTDGLCDVAIGPSTTLGDYFARNAHLEAAAVHAFERMIAELHAHGAPHALIAEAYAARADEVRHARIVGHLARGLGGRVPALRIEPCPERSLLAMAIENAVEGCVRETWGAVVGSYQAERAEHPAVASVLREIAEDERRHAALSWKVAAWLDAQLTPLERAEVMAAYREAIEVLRLTASAPQDARLRGAAGLPDAKTALGLLEELDASLWAEA